MWPNYSSALRKDVDQLLRRGGSLSAYRANPLFPAWTGPSKGSWAERLERDAERRFGVRHAIAVNSGTAALHAALVALRLPRGSVVVTTPFSFSATSSAVLLAGYTPRYADVDPFTFNISPETVKKVLTKDVKAILPVSLFGGLSDVHGLKQFGIPVVEDAAQAVGARDQHGYSGTHADVGCYSFNGGKQLPAGEAGMVVTNSDKIAEAARLLSNHGENFHSREVGLNYRMNELTACVAFHGLQDLEKRNAERRKLASELPIMIDSDGSTVDPMCDYYKEHALYVVPMLYRKRTPDRALFCKRLKRMGIVAGEGYIQPPLHKYKAFRRFHRCPLPVVERLSSKELVIFSQAVPGADGKELARMRRCIEEACR